MSDNLSFSGIYNEISTFMSKEYAVMHFILTPMLKKQFEIYERRKNVMPYNEFEQQAEQYFEIGKQKLAEGSKGEARNNFNLALSIARKNGLTDLMSLIQSYLNRL